MNDDISNLPILYTFRRCPYAMRARMTIAYTNQAVELREISLKDKPQAMLDVSSKATVPVLVLIDQTVIDESLDVMLWALSKNDPDSWYSNLAHSSQQSINRLIRKNDFEFKPILDRYKYAARFPEKSEVDYREEATQYLAHLNTLLEQHCFLISNQITLADIAIFPFIRQFAFVDKRWFDQSDYVALKRWLDLWLESSLFIQVMTKYPQWHAGDAITVFPNELLTSS